MRATHAAVLSLAALALLSGVAWCQGPPRAYLVDKRGEVKIQRNGRGPWLVVRTSKHMQLWPNDHVQTQQQASVTVVMDHAKIRLGPRTHVIIPPPRASRVPGPVTRIWIVAGRVFLWLIGARAMEVASEGVVATTGGTKFLFEVEPGGLTTVTVLEGRVIFHNSLGSVVVGPGEQSSAGLGVPPSRPMRVDPSALLEWEASLETVSLGLEMRYFPSATPERLQERLAEARRAAQTQPTSAQAWLRLGDALNDTAELLESEDAYRQALAITPDDLDLQLRLAVCLLQQGRLDEAEALCAAVERQDTGNVAAITGQAAALACSARPDSLQRARDTIARALALRPDDPMAHTVAGLVAMRSGDAEAARSAFTQAIQRAPDLHQAHAYLAAVQLAERDAAAALQTARRAVALAPGSALAHESLAAAEFFAGDLAVARREVQLALAANPNAAGAHLLLADTYAAEGDLQAAHREAELAVALDPLLAPAFNALGMVALARNHLREAEGAFAKAIELSPKLVAARTGMGVVYARQGKLGQAMEAQKAAIALDSSLASAHNNLGAIYLALGRLEEAEREFQTAIAAQPKWSLPWANLALAYLEGNRFAEAVQAAEQAVKLGENSARVHTTLARVYLKQNRTNRAGASLRRALELDEDYALAHFEIAEVFNRQGRPRDALKHQLQGIVTSPSAMLQTREYSRTEARVAGGSMAANLKHDGRADAGLISYFLHAGAEDENWDRPHSDWQRLTAVGIVGRQTERHRTQAIYASLQQEDRDRPGRELPAGQPEDPNYTSSFHAGEVHGLAQFPTLGNGKLTVKAGYRTTTLKDANPDSLNPDPRPFRSLKLRYRGPLAEVRLDKPLSEDTKLVAGLAASGEERRVSGWLGRPPVPGSADPVFWTRFADGEDRDGITLYLDAERQLSSRARLLVGGRMAAGEGISPVVRPRANLRYALDDSSVLVLLTRPVLADDVSELSPVDNWALNDWLSPLDFGRGGYGQSYELQYQIMPRDGSLVRLAAFWRSLKNFMVDLQDPSLAPGAVGEVVASGVVRGAEIEAERWLGRDLTAGLLLRYTDSDNDDAGGREIPYVPRLAARLRLDYLDARGYRASLIWDHVGRRYADFANLRRLGSYSTVTLSLARQFNLHTDVFLNLENLLDRDYGYWEGFPEPGRRIRAGVLYRF